MGECFPEYHVSMFGHTFLQFLLQIPAPMLISAQRWYFSLKIFEAGASKTVDFWNVTSGQYCGVEKTTYTPDLRLLAYVWDRHEIHLTCFLRVRQRGPVTLDHNEFHCGDRVQLSQSYYRQH